MEQAREADPVRTAARSLVEMWKEHIGVNSIGYSAADLIKKVNEQTRVQTAPGVNEDEFRPRTFVNLLAQQAGTLRGEIDPQGSEDGSAQSEGKSMGAIASSAPRRPPAGTNIRWSRWGRREEYQLPCRDSRDSWDFPVPHGKAVIIRN